MASYTNIKEKVIDITGEVISAGLSLLIYPILLPVIYFVFKEPEIKIKPLFRKPTIRFLEKQLGRVEDAMSIRWGNHRAFSDGTICGSIPKCDYSDINVKKIEILKQIIPLYEGRGKIEKVEVARQLLNELEKSLGNQK